ncbi:MAG: hypothetical protein ABFD04_03685 [Syntrophomonas sp.]
MKYIFSFFKPVTVVKNGVICVIIRGMKFQGASWEGIAAQIEERIAFFENALPDDMRKVEYSLPGGNIHGKWNPNLVVMGNDLKNLDALKNYLEKILKK